MPTTYKPLSESDHSLICMILQSKKSRAQIASEAGLNRSTVNKFVAGENIKQETKEMIKAVL